MVNEIELISDGEGFIVSGSNGDVENFLASEGLSSLAKDISRNLGRALRLGSAVAQAGSAAAARSIYWLKLTEESASLLKKHGLMEGPTTDINYAMFGKPGAIKSWLKVDTGSGAFLTNPANLSGIGAIIAQIARQHEMEEIKAYLARIDRKIDDVIQGQKNGELARLDGADMDIKSAMEIMEQTGTVDDDTWSTVQARNNSLSDTLSWSLRCLDTLAERVDYTAKIGELAEITERSKAEIQDLLLVVANCFKLQDAIDTLRLQRVLDNSPEMLDAHRRILKGDRQERRKRVSRRIRILVARMNTAACTANSNVLLHRRSSPAVVGTVNLVSTDICEFCKTLGIEYSPHTLMPTRWRDAVRNRVQLKNAAAEATPVAIKGAGTAAVIVAAAKLRNTLASQEGDEQET